MVNSTALSCSSCGIELGTAIINVAWEYSQDGTLKESKEYEWIRCKKCGHTMALHTNQIVSFPTDIFIPTYCPNCEISFYGSSGICELCGSLGGSFNV